MSPGSGPSIALTLLIGTRLLGQDALPLPIPIPGAPMTRESGLPSTARNSQGLLKVSIPIGNTLIDMIQIPAGTFQMGSESGRANERPVHTVTIEKPFWISKFPITQGQWQALMGFNPSRQKEAGPDAPVESVTSAYRGKGNQGTALRAIPQSFTIRKDPVSGSDPGDPRRSGPDPCRWRDRDRAL
jgi:hypothetical protein